MRRAAALLALVLSGCAPSVSDGAWVWCQAHPNEVIAAADSLSIAREPWIGEVERDRRADPGYTRACQAAYEAK